MNTQLRTKATNDAEKDLFKLANNSVFSRTMMNVKKRVNVKICNEQSKKFDNQIKSNYIKNVCELSDKL